MRELVYLSERKLSQLLPGKRRRWALRIPVEAEFKFPGLGGVKLGPLRRASGDRAVPDLEAIISKLEASDRAALWYADDDVQPGQWVYFEVPLCYSLVEPGLRFRPFRPVGVLFVDYEPSSESASQGNRVRLLMHGSHWHLRDRRSAESGGRRPPDHLNLSTYSGLDRFVESLRRLNHVRQQDTAERGSLHRVMALIFAMEQELEPELTAAWMAGYARVTAVLPEYSVVLATPLYVERVSPPSIDR
ncbi:SAVMC3_10250 family protein [Streptomyces hokutonensis]|uniref:SAVMC3_10250 family protein n=1 Tax=Streptomyces hokutonensis TaxID=1306990 RepID=UPI00037962BE|nr:SAVMC3_10250 family protein [Streptomyces hokutonensis]